MSIKGIRKTTRYTVIAVIIPIGVSLLICGIWFEFVISLTNYKKIVQQTCITTDTFEYELVSSIDYWDCRDDDDYPCYLNPKCMSCNFKWEVENDIEGDVVIGYHLDDLEDDISQSRDDNQLRGILSEPVSSACAPYDRDEATGRPVAPCGALANAMFTDKILSIKVDTTFAEVPSVKYGLLHESQKRAFRNPPVTENAPLSEAFKSFSKPKDWTSNVWELDESNPENNGFQNEGFIAWMSQELPVKIIWRLDRKGEYAGGLRKGSYLVLLNYSYPYSRYKGSRWLTMYKETAVTDTQSTTKYFPSYKQLKWFSKLWIVGLCIIVCICGYGVYDWKRRNLRRFEDENKTLDDPVSPSVAMTSTSAGPCTEESGVRPLLLPKVEIDIHKIAQATSSE